MTIWYFGVIICRYSIGLLVLNQVTLNRRLEYHSNSDKKTVGQVGGNVSEQMKFYTSLHLQTVDPEPWGM